MSCLFDWFLPRQLTAQSTRDVRNRRSVCGQISSFSRPCSLSLSFMPNPVPVSCGSWRVAGAVLLGTGGHEEGGAGKEGASSSQVPPGSTNSRDVSFVFRLSFSLFVFCLLLFPSSPNRNKEPHSRARCSGDSCVLPGFRLGYRSASHKTQRRRLGSRNTMETFILFCSGLVCICLMPYGIFVKVGKGRKLKKVKRERKTSQRNSNEKRSVTETCGRRGGGMKASPSSAVGHRPHFIILPLSRLS